MDPQENLKPGEEQSASEKDISATPSLLQPGAQLHPGSTSANSNVSDTVSIEKAKEPLEEQKPPRDVHGFAWALVIVSILSSTFLFALDNTIVADVQPAIVERFGSITKLPWLSVAFLVAAASTNLVW